MKICDVETDGEFMSSLRPKAIQFYSLIKE